MTADAISHGLGAALLQVQEDGTRRSVTYASRSLTETEQRYAQIEKKALASTWACEKFAEYLIHVRLGHFTIETDHKPLVPLLGGSKALSDLPPSIQRFHMRLMKYHFSIIHVPGKQLETADALSRATSSLPHEPDQTLQVESNIYLDHVVLQRPASPDKLEQIRVHQPEDEVCQTLIRYCQTQWPAKHELPGPLKHYWQYQGSLTVGSGLLLFDSRIFIPSSLRLEMLTRLHDGHQGVTRTKARARQAIRWPGIGRQIEETTASCTICTREQTARVEPLKPTPLPDRPWQRVDTDLFSLKSGQYVTVVDYYSCYPEIAHVKNTDSAAVIDKLKSVFTRHGVPEVLILDNGPQYSSAEFAEFARSYGFTHVTSSPKYPRANGAAERSVQTLKGILQKAEDPYKALLAYRSTPLENGYSPAELLFGRRIRNTIPALPDSLLPKLPDMSGLREKEAAYRDRTKANYDRHHRAIPQQAMYPGNPAWIRNMERPGIVEHALDQLCSCAATGQSSQVTQ